MFIGVYDDGRFGIDCLVVNNLSDMERYQNDTTRITWRIQSFNKYIASSSKMSRIMLCQTATSNPSIG